LELQRREKTAALIPDGRQLPQSRRCSASASGTRALFPRHPWSLTTCFSSDMHTQILSRQPSSETARGQLALAAQSVERPVRAYSGPELDRNLSSCNNGRQGGVRGPRTWRIHVHGPKYGMITPGHGPGDPAFRWRETSNWLVSRAMRLEGAADSLPSQHRVPGRDIGDWQTTAGDDLVWRLRDFKSGN